MSTEEILLSFGKRGYQIVVDEHGIRVWFRAACPAEKLYEGSCLVSALIEAENHWKQQEEQQ